MSKHLYMTLLILRQNCYHMKRINNIDIKSLLEKPLWQLTAKEFCALSHYAYTEGGQVTSTHEVVRITGVRALATYLDCCDSTVFMLRRNGVLDEAIISQVGKKIVFNGEKARELAEAFQQEHRTSRRNNG